MAGRWLASFRDIQWKSALKVWEKLASRRSSVGTPAPSPQEPAPAEIKIPALERRVAQLEEEAAASFEVVSSIAQQHSQLTEQHSELGQVADVLLQRTRALLWACALLALAMLGLLEGAGRSQ